MTDLRGSRSVPPSVWAMAAALCVIAIFVGTAGWWPWDHDEVLSLAEVGVVPAGLYPGPVDQMDRMHRLLPVWYVMQHSFMRLVPTSEWGARLLPSFSGALAVIIAFYAARRWRGEWFGWSLLIMTGGSQALIWLSQQNRFYPIAMLWLTLGLVAAWSRWKEPWALLATIGLAVAATLTHTLTLVPFGLGAMAALACLPLGWVPRRTAIRLLAAAAASAGVYLLYSRPIMAGWVSGGTGGTNPLVSFVAQIGVPVLALALVGGVAAFTVEADRRLRWWVMTAALGSLFITAVPLLLRNWNPRYALFFMPAFWLVAAFGVATIAAHLANDRLRVAWLLCVGALLLPKFASHFIDGSRHDFRGAAQIVASQAPRAEVLSNWPADIQYYLEPLTHQRAGFWSPGSPLPSGEFVVVLASNAWDQMLEVHGRSVTVLGQVSGRRFDEQSHVVRVYRVSGSTP